MSVAWVAGPPLATFIMGALGNRAILLALAAVAVLNIAVTAAMVARRPRPDARPTAPAVPVDDGPPVSRASVAAVVLGFIALQATNSAAVSIMSLFVTQGLGIDVIWAGVALDASAALQIPALLLIGRLGRRFSSPALITSGCVAGIAYYAGMAFVSNPVGLIALRILNAWFFGVVAGVGLTLFQRIIPRPGLASGLYTNTLRLGAIASGPIIGFGSTTAFGYPGVFAACAALTIVAMAVLGATGRTPKPHRRARDGNAAANSVPATPVA